MQRRPRVAVCVDKAIQKSGKSHSEIADLLGWRGNMVSMIRTGRAKLPMAHIGQFADIVGINKRKFLRLVLAEYNPAMLKVIEEILGKKI